MSAASQNLTLKSRLKRLQALVEQQQNEVERLKRQLQARTEQCELWRQYSMDLKEAIESLGYTVHDELSLQLNSEQTKDNNNESNA